MKRYSLYISSLIFIFSVAISGQQRVPLPRASQKATVTQTVGVTDIKITYSRPAVKGRKIFGEWTTDVKGEATLDNQNTRPKDAVIVPYGHVWRTGANEATLFEINDDVLINGQSLKAGKYSLHTIPGKDEWTIIFNTDDGQWGSFSYDAKKDALRVKAKPSMAHMSAELVTYDFTNVTADSAQVNISWDDVTVPFTVKVADVKAATLARAESFLKTAKSDDWNNFQQAAVWAKQNGEAAMATKWAGMALKAADKQIKAKANYDSLGRRAITLSFLDRKDDAIKATEKAIAAGKAENKDTAQFEKRLADLKTGK